MKTKEKLILATIAVLITGLAIICNNDCEGCVLSDTKVENEENIDAFINSLN